ncbi:MAG: arginine--tRNA ligase [Anaerolineales bacterium]|jgi:arginyl-tRNA synthetase
MFETEKREITQEIRVFFSANDLPDPGQITWNPIPFSGEWGISTSFFSYAAKEARLGKQINVPKRAQEIAQDLADYLRTSTNFQRVEAINGYLNLFYSPEEFSRRVIDTVLDQAGNFGRGEKKFEQIMVEFSQPNTHKAFHVGHLRSAILGDVVCRILEFAGFDVVRANYFGDIGLHVIKWLWNYMKYHTGEKPKEDITRWMGDLYAEASRRLEDDPSLEAEIRELYARWDRRESEVVSLWEESRSWSIEGFQDMYQTLDIKFDRLYSNSEVEHPGKDVVGKLIDQGIADDERPGGPVLVRIDDQLGLEEERYRVMVILRSDGTALYQTEDLALALLKFKEYDLDRSIYVVDVRQSMHFQQVWKILEIAGYAEAKKCYHLAYELVNLPGNVTMASREGTVVLLEDLIREAVERAKEIVNEKNPSLDEEQKQSVAEAVGLGSLKYPMLDRDNTKIVTFDWESALDFNGQAAPYIQYAHVRANSILRRLQEPLPESFVPSYKMEAAEIELIDLISRLPNEVQRAAAAYKTLTITTYAYELARGFNDFYRQCPVLKAESQVRDFRLRLVAASRQAIANVLALLGIKAPVVM